LALAGAAKRAEPGPDLETDNRLLWWLKINWMRVTQLPIVDLLGADNIAQLQITDA